MALRINTNVSALAAHKNMIKNDNMLSSSLEKLSSGLRINRAADDASGMAIADSLKSQALGLGQAIKNANDGISMVQTADGALDESIKIVNTIKTKAIQAAQDGQTTESRKAIQSDINKLLEELDIIAKTTAFNNQKLLSGNFVDKKFQVGAYSGETVNISISSAESAKVGHVTTGKLELTNASGGAVQLSIYSNLQSKEFTLEEVTIDDNNNAGNGMGALADAINKLSDVLGISAAAVVESTSVNAVAAGSTGSDFAINGVAIGSVNVVDNDSDGALVKAINNKTSDHGVLASVGADGQLKLTSTDGRAISLTGGTGSVLSGSNMSTFGYVRLNQAGSNELLITDLSSGKAVDFTTDLTFATTNVITSLDSTMTASSVLSSSSVLAAGSSLGANFTATHISADVDNMLQDSLIKAGSVLEETGGTVLEQGTIFGGEVTIDSAADVTTTADSLLKAGSVLETGTILAKGTVVTTDITLGTTVIEAGSVLTADTALTQSLTLSADMIALSGTVIDTNGSNTVLTAGSYVGADITLGADMNVTQDMTMLAGSSLASGGNVSLVAGSVIGGDLTVGTDVTLTQDMQLAAGSTLNGTNLTLAAGSTLGATMVLATGASWTAQSDITLAAGSIITSGSTLKAGTLLTVDVTVDDGSGGTTTIEAGTVLEQDYVTNGDVNVTYDMTIKKDSILASGSTMAANAGGASGTKVSDTETNRLADVSVLTQDGAQIAIAVADSALKDLDKVRADLGSVQNQLTATISNLSATRVNIYSAESAIRDVDFAEEAANFSKMQILTQASSFAMAQANASSQTVLTLLQG